MYLQDIIKISTDEAKILRGVINKENFLLTLKDSNFLCNDLTNLPDHYGYRKNSKGNRIGPVDKKIGEHTSPDFELTTEYGFNRYVYSQTKTPGWKQNLRFLCGVVPDGILYGDGINLYIMAGRGNNVQVRVGAFLDPEKDKEGLIWNRTIAGIAGYFHNRETVYSRVYENLLEDKKNFSDNSSEPFINDLLPLFSIKNIVEENHVFDLDFEKIDANLVDEDIIKTEDNWKLLGRMSHFVQHEHYAPLEFETNIWLDNNDNLIFNIFRKTKYYGNNEEFRVARAFVRCNTEDYLNQLISCTNFGMILYNKVKAKIFLSEL